MNTKEAIDWIEDCKDQNLSEEYDNKKMNEIVKLLKRGEKYRELWEEFKRKYKYYPMAKINKDGLLECTTDNMLVEYNMDEFEQKYFPKGGK